MKKLLFLAGSLRTKSYNKMLARTAADMAMKHQGVEVKYIDLINFEMPVYNADIEESSGLPQHAKDLKQIFAESSGIFIATPEYNSSYSAVLKNTIDWISRPHEEGEASLIAFKGKTVAIAATSPGGLGGIRALVPLRLLLSNISMNVMGDQLAIPFAGKVFDENGNMVDESKAQALSALVEEFVKVVS